jgi:hypothetical protein
VRNNNIAATEANAAVKRASSAWRLPYRIGDARSESDDACGGELLVATVRGCKMLRVANGVIGAQRKLGAFAHDELTWSRHIAKFQYSDD